MTSEDDFRIRPGRIRSRQIQHAKPFVAQALAAAQKAGGHVSRKGRISAPRASRFGRGRVASVQANRLLTSRSRLATIKTRIVRHSARRATLGPHLNYLRREGVARDGEKARVFGPETDNADVKEFTERCEDDRHHFRFIVSPEDASEMADLKGFARDLMSQVEKDLGTKLDWVGVDHWNTDNPHVHIILRGRADDAKDLVIARDYISEGMRARAQDLVTQELGPRTDRDIRRSLDFGGTAVAAGAGLFGASVTVNAPVEDANAQNNRATLISQYNAVIDQIKTTAQDSSFNGVNLLNGDQLKLVFNETGKSTLTIQGVTFDPAGLGLASLVMGTDFLDNASTNKVLDSLNNASGTLRSQASTFGSNLSIVQIRQDFSKNLINVLQTGSSNLTLADTNEEAANSQALATRQSIAVSALALANQSQQSVLQLLR